MAVVSTAFVCCCRRTWVGRANQGYDSVNGSSGSATGGGGICLVVIVVTWKTEKAVVTE